MITDARWPCDNDVRYFHQDRAAFQPVAKQKPISVMTIQPPSPRQSDAAELHPGMVFEDQRHAGEQTSRHTLVFADSRSIILEASDGGRQFTSREQFDRARGSRWKQIDHSLVTPTDESDTDTDDRTGVSISPATAMQSAIAIKRDSYARENTSTTFKIAALNDIEQILEPGCFAPVEFTQVDGIGEQTAANLRAHEITTPIDVRAASDSYLSEVQGIGPKTLNNLRETVTRDS